MEKVGIIACAFGQQAEDKPGPSNEWIGKVTSYIRHLEQKKGNTPFVSTQWEIAGYMDTRLGDPANFWVSVYQDSETHYIDTKGVLDRSLKYFQSKGVTRVIILAHPFHLFFIRLLITMRLWKVGKVQLDWSYSRELNFIPFDKSEGNVQSWTRGPFVFVAYLFKALLTKKHGN